MPSKIPSRQKVRLTKKTIIFYFWDCLSDLQENFKKNIKH